MVRVGGELEDQPLHGLAQKPVLAEVIGAHARDLVVLGKIAEGLGDRMGRVCPVRIDHHDDLTDGLEDAGLSRRAGAAVLGVADHPGALGLGDLRGAVGGTVVDDDELVIDIGRRHGSLDVIDHTTDRQLLVVCGQNDADRLAHGHTSPLSCPVLMIGRIYIPSRD